MIYTFSVSVEIPSDMSNPTKDQLQYLLSALEDNLAKEGLDIYDSEVIEDE